MESKKRLYFPVLIVCVGLILTISLASIFFSLSSLSSTTNKAYLVASQGYNIYFLALSDNSLSAKNLQEMGHSGYVWQQGENFYTTLSGYKNENDATLMKNKLEKEGLKLNIIKENFSEIKASSNFSTDEKEVLYKALNSFHDAYLNLYDLAISLDNNNITEKACTLSLNDNLYSFSKIKSSFDVIFSSSKSYIISTIKIYLTSCSDCLTSLSKKTLISPGQTLSSIIKYRYTEVLEINKNLLKELNTSKI